MPTDYLAKLNKLSPQLKAKLSTDEFLAELDQIDEQYGVKAILILLNLLLGELDYPLLASQLKKDYGFNDFLAEEVKGKFGKLIEKLGQEIKPASQSAASAVPLGKTKFFDSSFGQTANPITFSREDEEEIKKYINSAAPPKTLIDYPSQAKSIISRFSFKPDDEVMAKRLESIVVSRLRDIRDEMETRENLMKSRKIGGMEFSPEQSEELLKLIKVGEGAPAAVPKAPITSATPTQPVVTLLQPETPLPMPVPSPVEPKIEMEGDLPVVRLPGDKKDFNDQLTMTNNQKGNFNNQIEEKNKNELSKLTQDVKIISAEAKLEPKKFDSVSLASRDKLPPPQPAPFIATKTIPETVLTSKTVNRPNLDDVKFTRRLEGPVEELENMTLIDFRRLAVDPKAATGKVREKIDLLEKEGLEKKISGIAAWQKNEISRFYRLLGQASMTEGKSIETIIKERLLAGKPTLSLEEFEAVMELNRALRY